jgi:hypothetical protein
MELFEKIIVERISECGQLSPAEQARLAADPQLGKLMEQNAELLASAALIPSPPELGGMLQRVRLSDSLLREPVRSNWLEQFFGRGWQGKSLGSLAFVAVLIAALVAIPGMLKDSRVTPEPRLAHVEADNAALQAMLAGAQSGAWLEYALTGEFSERERTLLGQKLELAVSENSAGLAASPQVSLLADGVSYAVFVPTLSSTDARVDNIDRSIRRVEQFSLLRRSNRLYVQHAADGGDVRVIPNGNTDIAYPAALNDRELLGVLEAVVPMLPGSGLPADALALGSIVSAGYAKAQPAGSALHVAVGNTAAQAPRDEAQPGISVEDERALQRFEEFELRLGSRFEHSLANYELSAEQIEVYRRDMEQELTLHLMLPSNWDQLERRELDDYVYAEMLRSFRALGIETTDIQREQIAVYVNDEDAGSEQLPDRPTRLMVDIRQ